MQARFQVFATDNWTARPGVPTMTVGTVTATSIQVTAGRGLYIDGNSGGGADGRCGGNAIGGCKYVCWATCVDFDQTSTDPACSAGTESAYPREIGSQFGAAHAIEDTLHTKAPRDIVTLQDGDTGTLRGLATGTEYAAVCVAVSPTGISHPAVRFATTP